MAEPLLSVSGLASGYGEVQVLWHVDLDVAEGEMVCLIGSNGAGKTTLLRTISGVVRARSGQVRFNGADLSGANLANVRNLVEGQLFGSIGNATTLLPSYLERPSTWLARTGEVDHAEPPEPKAGPVQPIRSWWLMTWL